MNEQTTQNNLDSRRVSLILGGARSGKSALAEKLASLRATADNDVLYVATLLPYDQEMRQRISQHRQHRPASWLTLEAPYNLRAEVEKTLQNQSIVLLDCLTLWTSNLVLRESQLDADLIERNGMYGEIYDDEIAGQPNLGRARPPLLDTDREENITSDLQVVPRSRKQASPDYERLEKEILSEISGLVQFLRQKERGFIIVSNEVGLSLVPPYPLGRVYRDLLGRVNQQLATLADDVFMVYAGIPVELKKLQAEFLKK